MRSLFLFLFLSLSISLQSQSPVIKLIDNFKLDGFPGEWNQVSSITLSDQAVNNSPGVEIAQRNEFNNLNDLSVKIKFGWNSEGLLAFVVWRDDLFHESYIPAEKRRWRHPSGRSRDRLYYFDDMSIRIFGANSFYQECWVAPREKEPIQWYSGAIGENGASLTELPHPKIQVNKPELGVVQMEISWPWDILGLDPTKLKDLTIQVLVTDSDHPEKSMLEKEKFITYVFSQRQKMHFSN